MIHSIHQETENSHICENIKNKVTEEDTVDDPLCIQKGNKQSENDNLCTEVKKGIDDDPLFFQKIHNSGDEENNTVADDIHNIKTDV